MTRAGRGVLQAHELFASAGKAMDVGNAGGPIGTSTMNLSKG